MERYCPDCKRTTPHDGQRCVACGQVSVVDESRAADWQPVALPQGLVDDAPAEPAATPRHEPVPVPVPAQTPRRPSVRQVPVAIPSETSEPTEPSEALAPSTPVRPVAPPARRVQLLVAGAAAVVVTIIAIAYVASRGDATLRYVVWPTAEVYDGPYAGPAITVLHRGEEVHLLQSNGDYWQIRDPDGRQGYIEKRFLGAARPPYTPGAPYVGCRQYLSEASNKGCVRRADDQSRICQERCPRPDLEEACHVQCQTFAVECRTGCR